MRSRLVFIAAILRPSRAMNFGIHVGHVGGPLGEMRRLWQFADANGLDWCSVSDHFQESPPRGGDMDCYEAIATLAAAAVDTTRVRLGSGVYGVAYRNPARLAKSLTTIDHLSNGRVDCGLGAGWHEIEARAYGYARPSIGPREEMRDEYAQIMRLLLDPERPRANLAFREGPYDWEALEAFAGEIVR
jgi:alkanesulfonate monooxygenase SsuD/methylene tetrahydromethanopterin reductase-like flavin-dependent oxidoreductase (luciferase family)